MKKEEFADREKDRNKAVPAPSEGELLPELGNSEGKKISPSQADVPAETASKVSVFRADVPAETASEESAFRADVPAETASEESVFRADVPAESVSEGSSFRANGAAETVSKESAFRADVPAETASEGSAFRADMPAEIASERSAVQLLSRGRRFLFALGRVARGNAVLLIALLAAAITCFFVPIDAQYADYFDLRTLSCLFCTLAVVAALRSIRFFVWLADVIVRRFCNMRNIVLALVFVTYFGSMIMANDMALVTFLPLGWLVLESCGNKKLVAFTFIMQNIAANLGGMLTPFGNPQNLYLYSYFQIPTGEFFAIMALPFAVAFVLILAVCLFVKPEPACVSSRPKNPPVLWRSVVYLALFVLSVLIVFRVFPYYWGLLAVVLALLVLDIRSFAHVDYSLLLTFCAFFVFSGNLARIPAVAEALGKLVSLDPLAFGALSCQVISNVPSAVLLSKFTENYPALLIAVNIGGLGTPIASLASLITLNTYRRVCPGETKKYLVKFLALNFSFLAVLFGAGYLTLWLFF